MSYLERLGLLLILWSLLLFETPCSTNVDRSLFLILFTIGGILFLSGEGIRRIFQKRKAAKNQKKIGMAVDFQVSVQDLKKEGKP